MTVPNLYRVITQAGNYLVVVILKAIDALGILGTAIDSLQVVIARTPVVLDRIDVLWAIKCVVNSSLLINLFSYSPSWWLDKVDGRMSGCDIRQALERTGTWSIFYAQPIRAKVNRFAPFARWASSTAFPQRWRDSTPWRRARRRTESQRRDTTECYRRHDLSLFSVTMRWNRAGASAWDRHWCDRAGSDTFATVAAPQSPLARRRSSWRKLSNICRVLSGIELMVPSCGPDRKVWLMWTTSKNKHINISLAFRGQRTHSQCFFKGHSQHARFLFLVHLHEWIIRSTT